MTEPLPLDKIFILKLTEIVLANLENENFGVRDLVKNSGYSRYKLSRKLHSLKNKNQISYDNSINRNIKYTL